MRPATQDPIVCDVQEHQWSQGFPVLGHTTHGESDVDDERLPDGAVSQDVFDPLESDLCSESFVGVGIRRCSP